MPINVKVYDARRYVEAVAEGELSLDDIETFLDAIIVADALPYRKLFDGRGGYGEYIDEEVMRLAARLSAYANLGPRGAAALVTPVLARLGPSEQPRSWQESDGPPASSRVITSRRRPSGGAAGEAG